MRRTIRSVAVTAIMAAGLPLGLAATTAHAGTAARSLHFHLVTTAASVRFLGERRIPGGDYAASWRVFGDTVRVAGPSGSTVVVPPPGTGHASVTVRAPSSRYKGSLAALAQAYARSGKSVAQDAMAVGYSAAQARKLAAQATGGAGRHPNTPSYTAGQIIQSPCTSMSGDNGNAYGRACDVQKMVQDGGGGNWYVGDEITGSADENGGAFNNLTSFYAYVNYGSYNTIVFRLPTGTIYGNCTPVTLATTYDNVNLSATDTICDTRMDPYGANTNNKAGTVWTGCDRNDDVEGVDSIDVNHSPSNASDVTGLTVWINWGFCL